MPHLTIEYSANVAAHRHIDIDALVESMHGAALATGVASLDALRTRAVAREHYAVADRHPDNGFVAVIGRFGAGRSDDEKQEVVNSLMDALDEFLGEAQRTLMLSVEYQEIDPSARLNKNNLRPLIAERQSEEDR